VIVDLREGSPTRRRWFGVELAAKLPRMLYVPEGFAHGFLTLADDTEVTYQISTAYRAELQQGIRWNDPAVGIAWPAAPTIVSPRDAALPLLTE
jgi:dTDP-4-dehydrorhamnose 3,5-epimerase